jgi:CRISPR-associated endoribonuclease Cas6
MRLNIIFSFQKLKLPINYNHILQAFILQLIDDAEYRRFLHNEGYTFQNRNYKMFTFSKLNGRFCVDNSEKTIEFFDNVSLKISAHDENIIRYCADSLLFKDEFELLNQKITVEKIEYENQDIKNNKIYIKTLSPITVYSTVINNSSKKTIYYTPLDEQFPKLIKDNLIKKYLAFYNLNEGDITFDDSFIIKEKNNSKSKMIITYYKNFLIKAWNGIFEIQGDPKLLKIGYDAGFGSKNSQGFGLVELM